MSDPLKSLDDAKALVEEADRRLFALQEAPVRPGKETGKAGNAVFFKMAAKLKELLDAAEVQASMIEQQARRMSKGDTMDVDPAKWKATSDYALKLTNKIHALGKESQSRKGFGTGYK